MGLNYAVSRAVVEYLDLSEDFEDPGLDAVCGAVTEYVNALPHIERTEAGYWSKRTHLGAVMLAARWYRRRNSPGGVESLGDASVYITRWDSDIARLLRIDDFRRPVIG